MTATQAAQPPQQPGDEPDKAPALSVDQQVAFSRHGIELRTLADVHRVAQWIVASKWNPQGMDVADCAVAILRGAPLGLGPVQSVECIAVINGRPSLWGDTMLGLCRRSPLFVDAAFSEIYTGKPFEDSYTAVCQVQRKGSPITHYSFSVADAKQAGLWGRTSKDGKSMPWSTSPKRMLRYRARAFALRDAFPDILQGMASREEMLDSVLDQVDLGDNGNTKTEQLAARLAPDPPVEPVPVAPLDATEPDGVSAPPEAPEAVSEPEAGTPVDLGPLRQDTKDRLLKLPLGAVAGVCKAYGANGVVELRAMIASMDDPNGLNDLRLAIVEAAGKARTTKGS